MTVKVPQLSSAVVCPATVFLPGDAGQQIPFTFDVHFKRLPTSERNRLNDWFVSGRPAADGADTEAPRERFSVTDLADAVVIGWNLADDSGPIPYSREARQVQEERLAGLEQAMVVSWFDHLFINQREAAAKNSAAPSGTGSVSTAPTATS